MNKLDMCTKNIADENYAALAKLFPNALTEKIVGYDEKGKAIIERAIDVDVLRQEISCSVVEGREERYQFTWPDKKKATVLANESINSTLRPCRKDSVDFDTTENLYIEGDNLEVLKLLQETYLGKIKMIYIDPPYNTGKDTFVYDDNYSLDGEIFSGLSGQYDESGNMLFDMRENCEGNGRFHTDWLNMMYSRLKLAKSLLADNGAIFISIDEKEIVNLTKICDEIFGTSNHLETFHIQVRYANKSLNEDNDFQHVMEYILIYAKNKAVFEPRKPSEPYDLSKFCYSFEELTEGETTQIANKTVTIFKAGEWKINKHDEGSIGLLKETWASGSIVKQSGTAAEFLSKYLIDRKSIDGLGVLYKIHNMGEDGLGYRYVTGPLKEDAIRGKFYSGVPLERIKEIESGTSLKYRPIVNYYDYCADFGNIRHEGGIAFNSGKKPIKMLQHLLYTYNYQKKVKCISVQIPVEIPKKDDLAKQGISNIVEVGKKRLTNVADDFLIACFDSDVTEETVKAVAQEKPDYAVFRDSCMVNDSVATNFEQIFATYSPKTVRKVL